jgi:hypothetical protein
MSARIQAASNPLEGSRAAMRDFVSPHRVSGCVFDDFREIPLKLLTVAGDKELLRAFIQPAQSFRKFIRHSVFSVRRYIESRFCDEGGVQVRERSFEFFPIHKRAANGLKKDGLRFVAALGEGRNVPGFCHG